MLAIIARIRLLIEYSGSPYQTLSPNRRLTASPTLTPSQLELCQLSCKREERVLFSNLSALWQGGELVQLLGPNGCGKTSLLRLLAGISRDHGGEIRWQGQSIHQQAWEYARSLLYIGHQPGIKQSLTPLENLRWYANLNSPVNDLELLDALGQLGIAAYRDTPCYQLSAGQLRRVALARLYFSQAAVWILDEPFTAIDQAGIRHLEARFQAQAQAGGLVIFTSHQDSLLPGLKTLNLIQFKSTPVGQGRAL